MRLLALALVGMLLAVPLATASPLAVLVPAAPVADEVPEGCMEERGIFVCEWQVDTTGRISTIDTFHIPVFERTLATITVRLEGKDNGWRLEIHRGGDAAKLVSTSRHAAPAQQLSLVVSETTTHVLDGGDPHWIEFYAQNYEFSGTATHAGAAGESVGTFTIVYQAEPVPDGVRPERPAATREVPQFRDVARDGRRGELDIVAAWLDDARLGDGLMEAHLALLDLSHVETNRSAGSLPAQGYVQWQMHFVVLGQAHFIEWRALGNGTSAPRFECGLYRQVAGPELLANPYCEVDHATHTLHAVIPERSIGTPGAGERFGDLSVNVDYVITSGTVSMGGQPVGREFPNPEDNATAQFGFALGGPVVWDQLNNCAFCVETVSPAWYQAPLAEDNIPDTLQVAGALAAVTTFLVGLLLVRRRRDQTKRLLGEIAEVERAYEHDTRAALLALGKLDTRFARMYHGHDITDAQYQVVSQRLATVATRFSLRHGLGLDDGEPGDMPGRRVPVRSGDEARREARQ